MSCRDANTDNKTQTHCHQLWVCTFEDPLSDSVVLALLEMFVKLPGQHYHILFHLKQEEAQGRDCLVMFTQRWNIRRWAKLTNVLEKENLPHTGSWSWRRGSWSCWWCCQRSQRVEAELQHRNNKIYIIIIKVLFIYIFFFFSFFTDHGWRMYSIRPN